MTTGSAEQPAPQHTVTGVPGPVAAHTARQPIPVRKSLLVTLTVAVLLGGIVAVMIQRGDSLPSAPGSAERITVTARVTPATGAAGESGPT